MLSVFDKVFKRSVRSSVGPQVSDPCQASPKKTSLDDLKPNTEITVTELESPVSNDLSRDIVFIDGAVENISHLLRELDPAADLYVLHLQSDGLEQIADYLSGRKNLLAVHLFCNGGQDFLNLGCAKLTKDSLSRIQLASLMRINVALAEQSDFLIYGCELGSNEAGSELVSNLAEIIGADIAVSSKVFGGQESSPEPVAEEVISTTSIAQDVAADPAIVGKTNGSNGTVIFDITGNIAYVADPGFYGADSFEYKVVTGDAIELVKVRVNIMPEDNVVDGGAVSHFNVVSQAHLTSVTSNHGLSLEEGELSLGENGKFELVSLMAEAEPLTVSVNLQKCDGEGSPSFKIAVAPSGFVPPIEVAEPIEAAVHPKTLPLETDEVAVEVAQEIEPETVEQIAEPEVAEPEAVVESAPQAATGMPLQYEDFSGGTLSFPFDPQLQEPELTGNSILGQLIIDSYVRPGTLFLDVNNSFDPREQGVVSQYLVKQADGSPPPEHVHIIRDGFFTVDQFESDGELDLLIEAELLDGHIVSRALRVNIETGSLEALAINGAANQSNTIAQAPISANEHSMPNSSAPINH